MSNRIEDDLPGDEFGRTGGFQACGHDGVRDESAKPLEVQRLEFDVEALCAQFSDQAGLDEVRKADGIEANQATENDQRQNQ
jgi:hypothetical protein